MKRVLLYSPAITLAAWTAIGVFSGFDNTAVNAVMMILTIIAIVVAQLIRDQVYEQRNDSHNGGPHGSGPTVV